MECLSPGIEPLFFLDVRWCVVAEPHPERSHASRIDDEKPAEGSLCESANLFSRVWVLEERPQMICR